jgi:hypothetical protein
VTSASVTPVNGVPRLLINGLPAPPLIFFFNTQADATQAFLAPQVMKAASRGVHIYSFVLDSWPWYWNPGDPMDYSVPDQLMNSIIAIDPEAMFLPRIFVYPPYNWNGLSSAPTGDYILYKNGPSMSVSAASKFFHDNFIASLRLLLRHYESGPLGARMLGYHIGGQNSGEWFSDAYRERGPDLSLANTSAFRAWLTARYGSDAALAAAWSSPGVTLATAVIPSRYLDRFPIHSSAGLPQDAFYKIPLDQDWIDFSEFQSQIIAQQILDYAQVVKQETQRRKLVVTFQGYILELAASVAGHWKASAMLLSSPDIDILAGPVSYLGLDQRPGGGVGETMAAIDSVALHGKLWINEDDTKTHLIAWDSRQPFDPPTKNLNETINVMQRNLGNMIIHRASTWWMDLVADGSFDDVRIWDVMQNTAAPLFTQLYANPAPYRPEVAVILDERSRLYEKGDWDFAIQTRAIVRNALARTGASVGYYYLDDFLSGQVSGAKVYLFLDLWYASSAQVASIHNRLNAEGATAIWQYAPGYLQSSGGNAAGTLALTGIQVSQADGALGSYGTGSLTGLTWGWNSGSTVSPRLVINDPAATIIGRYQSGNGPSAAQKPVGNYLSVLLTDFSPTSAVLRSLFRQAGVTIWTDSDDVIRTDGSWLVFHSASTGRRTLRVKPEYSLTPLGGGTKLIGDVAESFNFGDTRWYTIAPQPPVAAPSNVGPADRAVLAAGNVSLSWGAVNAAISYDVYFGTSPDPPLAGNVAFPPFSVNAASTGKRYYWRVVARNTFGAVSSPVVSFFVPIPQYTFAKIGIYRGGFWQQDTDGNGMFDPANDRSFTWGDASATPVTGDWSGTGPTKAGVYKNGTWYLDYNGNGVFDPGVDKVFTWGTATSIPVVGDWNGDGRSKAGVYDNGVWYLDYNGNGVFDPGVDRVFAWGGSNAVPVIGDWNADGRAKAGVYVNGAWYLDYNGNGVWDSGVDKAFAWGTASSKPVTGDWNGDGRIKIGVYDQGVWYLDFNGNYTWDAGVDIVAAWGSAGAQPLVGDWKGDGFAKIGVFWNGAWYLDYNGNFIWDSTDKLYTTFGLSGDMAIIGRW